MRGHEMDLTQGSISRQLWVFGWPLLLLNLCQTLYSLVDAFVVGRYAGHDAITGVTLGGQINVLATMFAIGLGTGCSVLIAQYKGAKQEEDAIAVIRTGWCVMLAFAAVLTAVFLVAGRGLLRLIGTPEEAMGEAYRYLVITSLGLVFVYQFNHISAVLRGLGDSRRPVLFVAIASGVHIVLALIFVAGLHMGAAGAALATTLSQGLSVLISALFLRRDGGRFQVDRTLFQASWGQAGSLLRVSIPASLQNIMTNLSYTILYSLVNTFGSEATAGVGITSRLSGFATLPGLAFSAAISTITGQNIGAGKPERAEQAMKLGLGISLGASLAFFVVFQVFAWQIVGSFAPDDELTIQIGSQYLKVICVEYVLVSVLNCQNGLIIGSGHTAVPMLSSMVNAVIVRLPLAFWFALEAGYGVTGVAMGNAAAPIAAIVISTLYIRFGSWREGRVLKKRREAE